jgi:hypothetical protein
VREPGFYWIRLLRPGALPEEVAYWDGSQWHLVSYVQTAADVEVDVLSEQLSPPTDGAPKDGAQ